MQGIDNIYLKTHELPGIDHWEADIMADYGGSDRKEGLISPDGTRHLVKYAEAHTRANGMDTSYVNNVLSEYISSHIFRIIGFPVHDTFIATRNHDLLVGCRNFVGDNEKLIEFGRYMRKYYDSNEIARIPDIRQIKTVLNTDPLLKPNADLFYKSYWERFIGDALVGNFDRHMGNWGYIVSQDTKSATESPIYDNGSTLYPALSEQGMKEVLSSPKEIAKRTLLFPKAALMINNKKVSYLDILSSNYDRTISDAVRNTVPKIRKAMPDILAFIQSIEFISATRKRFYSTMLDTRMKLILQPAYERCAAREYDRIAYQRVDTGTEYNEQTFENQWKIHQTALDA